MVRPTNHRPPAIGWCQGVINPFPWLTASLHLPKISKSPKSRALSTPKSENPKVTRLARSHNLDPFLVSKITHMVTRLLSTKLYPDFIKIPVGPAQNQFDVALASGRAAVEQAIGLLKGRWRILQDLNVGLNHAPQTIVACCVQHNICQIAREPEPALFKDPKEMGPPARVLESEKLLHYVGEKLRQAMADDLQERQQRLSSRLHFCCRRFHKKLLVNQSMQTDCMTL